MKAVRVQSNILIRPSKLFHPKKEFIQTCQCIHTASSKLATAHPITAPGPPPGAPLPAATQHGERIERRRRQAEMLQRGRDLKAGLNKPGNALKKRFWKDVHVKQVPGMFKQPLCRGVC